MLQTRVLREYPCAVSVGCPKKMFFFAGTDTGQIKLVSSSASQNSQFSTVSSRSLKPQSEKLSAKTVKASAFCTTLPSPLRDPNREWAVTSLAWSRWPRVMPECDPLVTTNGLFNKDIVISASCRDIVVGRLNGVVEGYTFPDAFSDAPGTFCNRRFRLPGPIVFASGCALTDLDVSSDHFVTCLCATGEGVIVNWDPSVWERTDDNWYNVVFKPDYPTMSCGKTRKGRLERSDGAQPCAAKPSSFPFPLTHVSAASRSNGTQSDLCSTTNNAALPSWLISCFKIPGPIGCAAISGIKRSKLVVGGQRNLPKIVDLTTETVLFSAKNARTDCLDLSDPVFVTSLAFLDALSNGAHCIAAGNENGRLYIYDTRLCGKPVLDVQICERSRSITALSPRPAFSYSSAASCFKHCNDTDASVPSCLTWTCDAPCLLGKNATTNAAQQTLVISDNHGTVYLYDIRATSSSRTAAQQRVLQTSEDETAAGLAPNKKAKWEPHKYRHYEPNTVVYEPQTTLPLTYTAARRYHLPSHSGSVTDFSWFHGSPNSEPQLLGITAGRCAYLWHPNDKRRGDTPIHLKSSKLTCCLAVDVYKSFDDESHSSAYSTSDASSGDDTVVSQHSDSCSSDEGSSDVESQTLEEGSDDEYLYSDASSK